jgi:hypothetical protein
VRLRSHGSKYEYTRMWLHGQFPEIHREMLTSPSECIYSPNNNNIITPWLYSASEIYRPSGRRLPANLVPTLAVRGLSRGQRSVYPTAVISDFWTGASTFHFK